MENKKLPPYFMSEAVPRWESLSYDMKHDRSRVQVWSPERALMHTAIYTPVLQT